MSLIADLIRAGVDPDLVARVSQEIADARAEGASGVLPERTARQERKLDVTQKEWAAIRLVVLQRDGFLCLYCGSDGGGKALHCDHVVPLAKGGKSVLGNLKVACKTCNSSKKDKFLSEWKQ